MFNFFEEFCWSYVEVFFVDFGKSGGCIKFVMMIFCCYIGIIFGIFVEIKVIWILG